MVSSAGSTGTASRLCTSAEEARWLRTACDGVHGTVGSLVPVGHDAIIRLHAPDASVREWVDAYRILFVRIAELGAAHTTTPDHAWFAHEYGNDFGLLAPPADDQMDEEQCTELVMPQRSYRLTAGAVESVVSLRHPGFGSSWRHPDLFWPLDRAWFVGTDVDFWSLYVAGTTRFITRVMASGIACADLVGSTTPLVVEE